MEITSADIILQPVSPSFHARDILCPAAAHLAAGLPIESSVGRSTPARSPASIVAQPEVARGKIQSEVVDYNRFGNVQLNVRSSHFEAAGLADFPDLAVEASSGADPRPARSTYADLAPGEYGVSSTPAAG